MRTFKQFKVGDIDYELSYDSFTHIHKYSTNRAYLKIVGDNRIFRCEIPKNELIHNWHWSSPSKSNLIADKNKAQEIRRLIILFLTNSL